MGIITVIKLEINVVVKERVEVRFQVREKDEEK